MTRSFIAAAAVIALAGCSQQKQAQQPPINQSRVATSAPAAVSGAAAKAALHERRDGMEKIGKTNKLLRREVTAGSPDMAAVKSAAATMNDLAGKASGWFPAGTGPDAGKTGAKPEIWQKPRDFAAKLKAFQTAAKGLDAAARGGNPNALAASFETLGKSCKACHDSYRSKSKD